MYSDQPDIKVDPLILQDLARFIFFSQNLNYISALKIYKNNTCCKYSLNAPVGDTIVPFPFFL